MSPYHYCIVSQTYIVIHIVSWLKHVVIPLVTLINLTRTGDILLHNKYFYFVLYFADNTSGLYYCAAGILLVGEQRYTEVHCLSQG